MMRYAISYSTDFSLIIIGFSFGTPCEWRIDYDLYSCSNEPIQLGDSLFWCFLCPGNFGWSLEQPADTVAFILPF